MDLNKLGFENFSDSFSQEDMKIEYRSLVEKYKWLKVTSDADQQKIYELRRNWETASAAEAYLAQELELLTTTQSVEIENAQKKMKTEIEDLKRKYSVALSQNIQLEQKIDEYREENDELNKQVEKLKSVVPEALSCASNGSIEREFQLAKENLELLAKIDEEREKFTASIMNTAQRERNIETLKEHIQCLEENLQAKHEEVEEKTQLLESAQERLMELGSELAMLKAAPENAIRKGNSLFAEVDDQRQEMKKILAAQKKHYLQMKKCYNESEQEIRRLKRENAAMYREMQACATIFLNADRQYKEELNGRILHLLKQNEHVEKKLSWTQEKLIALSNDKGINWLDSMLAFCKTETKELKEQLRSCRLQKGCLEESLHKSQQELARWRFEALKSRCIVINRETLLEENNISFVPRVSFNFKATNTDCANAKPKLSNASDIEKCCEQSICEPESNFNTSERKILPLCPPKMDDDVDKDITPTSSRTHDTKYTFIIDSASPDKSISITSSSDVSLSTTESNENLDTIWSCEKTESVQFSIEKKKVLSNSKHFAKTPFKVKRNLNAENYTKISDEFEVNENSPKWISMEQQEICSTSEKDKKTNFEICEDSVCRLPLIERNFVNQSPDRSYREVDPNKAHCDASSGSINLTENFLKPIPHSILVKNRDVFDEVGEGKAVTFSPELTTEIKSENYLESSQNERPRNKSNVLVKRIVVNSNFNQKQNK